MSSSRNPSSPGDIPLDKGSDLGHSVEKDGCCSAGVLQTPADKTSRERLQK